VTNRLPPLQGTGASLLAGSAASNIPVALIRGNIAIPSKDPIVTLPPMKKWLTGPVIRLLKKILR
jgi:hypothetical protein